MGPEKQYRIGELARLSGVNRRTIDFYTRMGLLIPEERTDGNFRIYNANSLEQLTYITELKQKKFSLEEIKILLNESRQHLTDPKHLMDRVHKLQEDLLVIEREVASLKPELSQAIESGAPKDVKRSIQRALLQGLSLAQAIILLLDPNFFNNL